MGLLVNFRLIELSGSSVPYIAAFTVYVIIHLKMLQNLSIQEYHAIEMKTVVKLVE
jgi:hypothetical protein